LNKHTRLVASLLFVVIIILAAAITRFYLNVPDDVANNNTQTEIVRKLISDSKGNYIFSDGNGSFGIADSEDRIIVAPEWNEIRFAGNGKCIAAAKTGSQQLYGCIDYEGNIVIPFIYSSITKHEPAGNVYYVAESAADNSCVLYDDGFSPCFRRSWTSCSIRDKEVTLADSSGVYTFSSSKAGLFFTRASVTGETMGSTYTIDILSRVLLSKLSIDMIEDMSGIAGKYIEYAFTGNDEILSEITTGSRSGFSQLFPDDHRLLSKELLGISDIHLYSIRSDDGTPCYEVAFTADTGITYTDENGEQKTLREGYKAAVKFSGNSVSDLKATSGCFENEMPEYPKPAEKTDISDGADKDENSPNGQTGE
jgi:hypothetical protein